MSLSKLDAYNVQVLHAFSKADKDAEILCTNREGRLRIFSKTEAEHSLGEWTFVENPDTLLTEKIGRLGQLLQSDEEKARAAFERVRTRMALPEPLTEEEIHAFYKELFETSIASISCRQTEEVHPACLIPPTLYINIRGKIGSIQRYIPNSIPLRLYEKQEIISKTELQASLVFDICFNNGDRHLGNLLVQGGHLWMIDHGDFLSTSSLDPLRLEQLALPQMEEAWDPAIVQKMDSEKVTASLRSHRYPEEVIQRTRRATEFVKKAIALGLSPYETGLIARDSFKAFWNEKEFSDLMHGMEKISSFKNEIDQLEKCSRATFLSIGKQNAALLPATLLKSLCGYRRLANDAETVDFRPSILGKYAIKKKKTL